MFTNILKSIKEAVVNTALTVYKTIKEFTMKLFTTLKTKATKVLKSKARCDLDDIIEECKKDEWFSDGVFMTIGVVGKNYDTLVNHTIKTMDMSRKQAVDFICETATIILKRTLEFKSLHISIDEYLIKKNPDWRPCFAPPAFTTAKEQNPDLTIDEWYRQEEEKYRAANDPHSTLLKELIETLGNKGKKLLHFLNGSLHLCDGYVIIHVLDNIEKYSVNDIHNWLWWSTDPESYPLEKLGYPVLGPDYNKRMPVVL